ncbi:T9SS type A sorting domain-containing protein [Balneolaceae bacterium ANBcel3]|nr:T9SS type A sorting domain-containing protein [Balneolaceae bacterium ANBcel3]
MMYLPTIQRLIPRRRAARVPSAIKNNHTARMLFFLFVMLQLSPLKVVHADPVFELYSASTPAWSMEMACDRDALLPGTGCRLDILTDPMDQVQYIGAEVAFDTARFSFEKVVKGSFFEDNAVYFGQMIGFNTLGVSASSTVGEISGSGRLVSVYFRVREQAPSGNAVFSFRHIEAAGRDQESIPVMFEGEYSIELPPYIQSALLLLPGGTAFPMGSPPSVELSVYGTGFDDASVIEDGRITAEIGFIRTEVVSDTLHPSQWTEAQWYDVEFTGYHTEMLAFGGPLPEHLSNGAWYMAGRVQLDDHPPVYVGNSGEHPLSWNPVRAPSYVLNITVPRVVLAEWSFDREHTYPDRGLHSLLSDLDTRSVVIENARFNGWINGTSGRALNTSRWDSESSEAQEPVEKYYKLSVSTRAYESVQLSFSMNGSGTGPSSFQLQYRLPGNGTWEDVESGQIEVGLSWNRYHLTLPEILEDREAFDLRLLRFGHNAINGNEIGSSGTNRLDHVLLCGIPVNDMETEVWPGDTHNLGYVDEQAVMNIGYYWKSTGPARIPSSVRWAPQPVVQWAPLMAGFADTNGDGVVDYKDVLAIGRNFGKQAVHGKSSGTGSLAAVSGKVLPLLRAGETATYAIYASEPYEAMGVTLRLGVEGLSSDDVSLVSFEAGCWADYWKENERLLTFIGGSGLSEKLDVEYDPAPSPYWHGSWIHKGAAPPVSINRIALITLKAEKDWPEAPRLTLVRSIFMGAGGTMSLDDGFLVSSDELVTVSASLPEEIPTETRLHSNYPNPFNPSTIIPFTLAKDGYVQITVYDALGREAARLIEGHLPAGRHRVEWAAEGFSSGLYLYRLQTEQHTYVRSMLLVK